jgi:Altronate dehydratase
MCLEYKFEAYVRKDGQVGIRNKVLILPSVACVNHVASAIAGFFSNRDIVSVNHEVGCAQIGDDFRQSLSTLIGLASNPNVGAVLVVGLGCERIVAELLAEEISKACSKPLECIVLQKEGGTIATISRGITIVQSLYQQILSERKEEVGVSFLKVAVECGGSDYTSALAANPAVGHAVDKLSDCGAKIVISELIELAGAEEILASRCESAELMSHIAAAIDKYVKISKQYSGEELFGIFVPGNISPGNVQGGITTIEEKSLGAVSKGGFKCPVVGYLKYGERIPDKPAGLYIMDTPSYDIESVTGMVAGGATIVLFTTGLGTPVGNPISPVIKITGNSRTARYLQSDIDVDVSEVLEGQISLAKAGERIISEVLAVASGKLTKSETLGFTDAGVTRARPRL